MSIETKLRVTEIQRFCMHDGPGIRTTVFLKGCPLHCAWCHNPETQKSSSELLFYSKKCIGCNSCEITCKNGVHSFSDEHLIDRDKCSLCMKCTDTCPTNALEICGMEMSVEEILTEIKKDMAFYGKAGGVTISGGEPFLQGKNTLKLLKACKAAGISTAVETCGYADTQTILDAVPFVDWFLWDIKDTNNERHKHYTGVYNDLIFKNLYSIVEINANIKLRCILVNDVNTNNEHYESIAEIAKKINCEGVELIPYHAYGGAKASFLGEKDNGNIDWIPEESQIEYAKSVLKSNAVKVL